MAAISVSVAAPGDQRWAWSEELEVRTCPLGWWILEQKVNNSSSVHVPQSFRVYNMSPEDE
jgi:hypothetical protein